MEYPTQKLKIANWDARIELKNDKKKRESAEEFERLVKSIAVDGIRVPIMVVKNGNDYEVVGGRHRLAAAKKLGLKTVPISIHEDVNDEVHKRRLTGLENFIRSNGEDEGKAEWVFAMYQAAGYKKEEAALGVKSIDNYFSRGNGATWQSLAEELSSAPNPKAHGTNELRNDKKFIDICKTIPFTPKYQYQLMSILVKLDKTVREKADKKGLNTNKQISLTTTPLPQHPKIQKELIDEIADLPNDAAKTRVQEVASELSTGRIKKEGKTYIIDNEVKKENDKVLPPLNTRIIDINTSINKFLFNLTQRAITKGEHKYTQELVRATRNYRLEILKTLDERNLIMLEDGLKLVKLITDEMLGLIDNEYETIQQKKEMLSK